MLTFSKRSRSCPARGNITGGIPLRAAPTRICGTRGKVCTICCALCTTTKALTGQETDRSC